MVKYGERLGRALTGSWADKSLPYDELKATLVGLMEPPNKSCVAEGNFLTQLLSSIHDLSTFYLETEAAYDQRLEDLGLTLATPEKWIVKSLDVPCDPDTDLALVVKSLVVGTHIDSEHSLALEHFLQLCSDIDSLRKFSLVNALAVFKIVKKHDKNSSINLMEPIMALVRQQPFYNSTRLARAFTYAQIIVSEVIDAAAKSPRRETSGIYCSSCGQAVTVIPTIMPCSHKFCYSCLSAASAKDHRCPLCVLRPELAGANEHELETTLNSPGSYLQIDSSLRTTSRQSALNAQAPAAECTDDGSPAAETGLTSPDRLSAVAPVPAMTTRFPRPSSPNTLARLEALAKLEAQPHVAAATANKLKRPLSTNHVDSTARVEALGLAQPITLSSPASSPTVSAVFTGTANTEPAASNAAVRRRACIECHRAKAACDGGEPCTRCRRLGKTCVTGERQKRRRRASAVPWTDSTLASVPSAASASSTATQSQHGPTNGHKLEPAPAPACSYHVPAQMQAQVVLSDAMAPQGTRRISPGIPSAVGRVSAGLSSGIVRGGGIGGTLRGSGMAIGRGPYVGPVSLVPACELYSQQLYSQQLYSQRNWMGGGLMGTHVLGNHILSGSLQGMQQLTAASPTSSAVGNTNGDVIQGITDCAAQKTVGSMAANGEAEQVDAKQEASGPATVPVSVTTADREASLIAMPACLNADPLDEYLDFSASELNSFLTQLDSAPIT